MGKFLGFIALIVAIIAFIILRGLITADLWQWFLVPLGVKSIGIAHAIGLSFLVGLLFNLGRLTKSDVDPEHKGLLPAFMQLIAHTVAILLTWGSAAIVYYNFM